MTNTKTLVLTTTLWLTACGSLFEPDADYSTISTFHDENTNLYVELGRVETFSSSGYGVYIFKDKSPQREFDSGWNAIISVAGMGEKDPVFEFDGRCYVLTVEYRYGGLINPVWHDPESGNSMCFDLQPDPGPKGGFRP